MKRIIALLLALVTVFSLVSCGENLATTDESNTETLGQESKESATTPAQTETAEKEKVKTKVAEPLTWEKINSIPVATQGMSERELRQICLDFMELQLTFAWTPNETVHIRIKDHMAGTVYGGMPYVSSTFNNLYQLMKYYDEENGMMDVAAMGNAVETIMGNQCSANSFWGWARVSNTMVWGGTNNIVPARGAIYRGNAISSYMKNNYPDIINYTDHSTIQFLSAIGKNGVFQGYAELIAADGLVYNKNGAGHVMMVYEDAVVVYKNGQIDGEASYVVVQHQTTGTWVPSEQSDGEKIELAPGWRSKYTFQHLYEHGYMPFTLAELIGQDPVEPTEIGFSFEGGEISLSKLILATVSANYALSDVTVVITNADGKELARNLHCSHSSDHFRAREMTLAAFGVRRDNYSAYAGQGNTIQIYVRTGHGDQILAYSGILAK